jgi:glycosyltransferase involved in cell wall biosynthesis
MIVAYDLRYASTHFPGIGTHAFALIEALLELPGEERYVVLSNPDGRTARFDFDRLRAHPRVEWVERRYHPIRPLGALQVGAWLRRIRPDVYLSPFNLRPFAPGCPDVLTIYDVAPLRVRQSSSGLIHLLYLLSLRRAVTARFILTGSEFSRREIIATTSIPPERVRTAMLGVAPRVRGVAPQRPERLREERYALVVGENRPRKNLDLLVRAWASMGPSPALALVGVGPVDPRYPSLPEMAAAAAARRVVHLGWVEPAELAWLYAHADVVVVPSLYEGFGYPLVEACAEGAPALASDIPVFHEVGGGAVAYADPRDPAAWRRVIERIADDPAERGRMRLAGLARAAELTYRRTAEATLAVLREAAGGRA